MVRQSRAPLLFQLAKFMERHRIRGWRRVHTAVHRSGLLDREVVYDIAPGVRLIIPMHLNPAYRFFDRQFIEEYEDDLIASLADAAAGLQAPVTLVDVGADIGVFSAKLAVRAPVVRRVVAFEPNPVVGGYLDRNLGALPVKTETHHCALSDFDGKGELCEPAGDQSFHARFLRRAADGEIAVRTLDSFGLEPAGGLVLKLDVEGGEIGVVRGARETLRRAPAFVISVEAHPEVYKRTGIDPLECVRVIREVRDCRVTISEAPGHPLDIDRNFFEQDLSGEIRNLVCRCV